MKVSKSKQDSNEFHSVQEIARELDMKKGENIKIFDIREKISYCGIVLLASSLSPLHIKNLTEHAIHAAKRLGETPIYKSEFNYESQWIVLDFGYFVLHIITPEKRDFYELDAKFSQGKEISW